MWLAEAPLSRPCVFLKQKQQKVTCTMHTFVLLLDADSFYSFTVCHTSSMLAGMVMCVCRSVRHRWNISSAVVFFFHSTGFVDSKLQVNTGLISEMRKVRVTQHNQGTNTLRSGKPWPKQHLCDPGWAAGGRILEIMHEIFTVPGRGALI